MVGKKGKTGGERRFKSADSRGPRKGPRRGPIGKAFSRMISGMTVPLSRVVIVTNDQLSAVIAMIGQLSVVIAMTARCGGMMNVIVGPFAASVTVSDRHRVIES